MLDPLSATPFQRSAGGGVASTGRVDAGSAGRGGKVTTLSLTGLRTASRAE